MQIVVTNISSDPVFLSDLYTTIQAGDSVTTSRSGSELAAMAGLIAAVAAGSVTVLVTPTAAEIASGFLAPPSSVQAQDLAPVSATYVASGLVMLRIALVAGVPGTADDVVGYAANSLPFKFRALDVWAKISTGIALSTVDVWTRAAGAGTNVAGTFDSATAAPRVAPAGPTSTVVVTPGALEGLFVRRSDRGVAGEVFVLARIES